ncbi:qcr9 subunit 9 of the ubiquinol cytochrome-c reductase complex [Ascochyta lentis]
MAGFANTVYNTIIRSNVTLLGTVFAAAFGMQLAFDTGSERIWDNLNRGRQWKDIKQRYIEAAEDDE